MLADFINHRYWFQHYYCWCSASSNGKGSPNVCAHIYPLSNNQLLLSIAYVSMCSIPSWWLSGAERVKLSLWRWFDWWLDILLILPVQTPVSSNLHLVLRRWWPCLLPSREWSSWGSLLDGIKTFQGLKESWTVDDWVNTDHRPLRRGIVVHVGESLHGGTAIKIEASLINFQHDKISKSYSPSLRSPFFKAPSHIPEIMHMFLLNM